MNSAALATTGYGDAQVALHDSRQTEYRAFAEATRRLCAADAANEDTTGGFAALAEALHDNLRLWTLLAADVASDDNELPQQLRARIFYLAEFTRVHSRKVLSGDAKVRPLIDINTAIMKGLRAGATDGGAA
ncbi:flagellar biosynthesis regulator FlaF [Rhodovulum sp. DZ06]|uniref:flagellar biosynthesis regulator FlaF n=1 Tax=Rhodovulum sp. DZ06 TaxID=3425126 RepID=UPI003D32D699